MTSAARRRPEVPHTEVRVLGRGLGARRGVRLTLRAVREAVAKTQVEVSEVAAIDQADVSRLEQRASLDDCQVDTLRRYVGALGGQLEIVATFGDKRIVLVGATDRVSAPPSSKPLQRARRPKRPRRS